MKPGISEVVLRFRGINALLFDLYGAAGNQPTDLLILRGRLKLVPNGTIPPLPSLPPFTQALGERQ